MSDKETEEIPLRKTPRQKFEKRVLNYGGCSSIDGEEFEAFDSEESAKDHMVKLARKSRENRGEELSEMEEQLLRSQNFFMEPPRSKSSTSRKGGICFVYTDNA